jgi:hypothetical protein
LNGRPHPPPLSGTTKAVIWPWHSYWGFSMSIFQQYLSVITNTKANLYSQLRELERLRDQSGNAPNAWTVIDADPAAILGALFPHEY